MLKSPKNLHTIIIHLIWSRNHGKKRKSPADTRFVASSLPRYRSNVQISQPMEKFALFFIESEKKTIQFLSLLIDFHVWKFTTFANAIKNGGRERETESVDVRHQNVNNNYNK